MTGSLSIDGLIQIAQGSELCVLPADAGRIRYTDSNLLQYCNGSAWQTLGISGAGLENLNGLTGSSQTLAIGTTGTSPSWTSAADTHTLNIPLASSSGVTAGLLSKAEFDTFNNKQNQSPRLDEIADINPATTANFLLGSDGNNLIMRSPADARADLGLSSLATADSDDFLTKAGNLADLADIAVARSNLALGSAATTDSSIYVLRDGSQTMTGNWNVGNRTISNFSAQVVGGTAAAPGLAINGDTNTGLFAPAADTLAVSTDGTERLRMTSTGNLGVGNASPVARLDVQGQARTSSHNAGSSGTIDWNSGNTVTTSFDCGTSPSFSNMLDGGFYTLIVTGTGTATCNFSTSLSGSGAGNVTYRFRPDNGDRTASSHTIYSFLRVGNVVYVNWESGY